MRPVGHPPADLPVVAGGGVPPGDDHLDLLGDPLDLLEDVRAEQDGPALLAHAADELHQVEPLAGVHAVERLVEEEHLRVVDERGRHLDPLPHALGVRLDPAVRRAGHLDELDGPVGGPGRVGQAVQPGGGEHELPAGEEAVDRLLLLDQPDPPVDLVVAPDGLPAQGDRAGRRGEEARHHVDQRGLAGAVGAEQPGDPGPDRHGDVVDRHHVAVPAGDVGELDDVLAGHGGRGRGHGHEETTFR